jgi:hypothetical protein
MRIDTAQRRARLVARHLLVPGALANPTPFSVRNRDGRAPRRMVAPLCYAAIVCGVAIAGAFQSIW